MARPSIDPVVWRPPPVPPRARARSGPRPLAPVERIAVPGRGPEDVVVDAAGRLVTGLEDGRVVRVDPADRTVQVLADTGGRPLGIELAEDGDRLVVCDARRGLLRLDPSTGRIEVLCDEVDGERMRFCNNAAVAGDGTIWFTDSSRRFGIEHWMADVLEHSGTGRLLRRDPGGEVEVVLDGLQFANGVALSADGTFVAVAETGAYRIRRVRLDGDRAGRSDVLAELPGSPDNLALGSDGLIWVALANPRDPRLDLLHRTPPWVRRAFWRIPERLRPGPRDTAWALALDAEGGVIHDLQGWRAGFRMVTGVREHRGTLYLGSLAERAVGQVRVE